MALARGGRAAEVEGRFHGKKKARPENPDGPKYCVTRGPLFGWRLLLGWGTGGTVGPFRAVRLSGVYNEGAAHERLVVEDFHGALCLLKLGHRYETVALREMGIAVVDDVDIANCSHAFEEIFKIVFGSIIGKISYVEAS